MATFGETGNGTTYSNIHNRICASKFTLSEEGNATSITARVSIIGGTTNVKCAIYDASLNLIEITEKKLLMPQTGWVTFNLNNSPVNLPAGDYILAIWGGNAGDFSCWRAVDVGVSRWWASYVYGIFPNPISASDRTGKFSIYCTYTPPSAGTNTQINIGDAWKNIVGIKINIGDVWKDVISMQINIGDAWKTVF